MGGGNVAQGHGGSHEGLTWHHDVVIRAKTRRQERSGLRMGTKEKKRWQKRGQRPQRDTESLHDLVQFWVPRGPGPPSVFLGFPGDLT